MDIISFPVLFSCYFAKTTETASNEFIVEVIEHNGTSYLNYVSKLNCVQTECSNRVTVLLDYLNCALATCRAL